MKIVEDVLDILLFIFMLGLCVSVAFGIVYSATREDSTYTVDADKTAPKSVGEQITSEFNGSIGKMELVLMTQVQDFNIPEPKRFLIGSNTVNITNAYKSHVRDMGVDFVYPNIKNDHPDTRYTYEYHYGQPPTLSDIDTGNLVGNSKAEQISDKGEPVGWYRATENPDKVKFTVRRGMGVIEGHSSFEISAPLDYSSEGKQYVGSLYQEIMVESNTKYRFTGTLSCHRCEANFKIEVYDTVGLNTTYTLDKVEELEIQTLEFTTPLTGHMVRITMHKGKTTGEEIQESSNSLIADNISLQKMDGTEPHYLISKD